MLSRVGFKVAFKLFGKRALVMLGFNMFRGRTWVVLLAVAGIAVTGAFGYGYHRAHQTCLNKNAQAVLKIQEEYTADVVTASELAADEAVNAERRASKLRRAQEEIVEKYDEADIDDSCGIIFDADDLELYNRGNDTSSD